MLQKGEDGSFLTFTRVSTGDSMAQKNKERDRASSAALRREVLFSENREIREKLQAYRRVEPLQHRCAEVYANAKRSVVVSSFASGTEGKAGVSAELETKIVEKPPPSVSLVLGGGELGKKILVELARELCIGSAVIFGGSAAEIAELEELSDSGLSVIPLLVDVTDDDSLTSLREYMLSCYGRVTIMINCLGACGDPWRAAAFDKAEKAARALDDPGLPPTPVTPEAVEEMRRLLLPLEAAKKCLQIEWFGLLRIFRILGGVVAPGARIVQLTLDGSRLESQKPHWRSRLTKVQDMSYDDLFEMLKMFLKGVKEISLELREAQLEGAEPEDVAEVGGDPVPLCKAFVNALVRIFARDVELLLPGRKDVCVTSCCPGTYIGSERALEPVRLATLPGGDNSNGKMFAKNGEEIPF
uniref:Ketoreductase (KR) domain-containing protein n=1 Tax=Chromera velia CCMP2878 TaxID=1169474 RepID=A0A0G4HYG4_9ALVE|eukprot:Cvel_9505.t1-p1 / transcript=Cvel_9505.t1 / gene=Cvel_9505 / organism=Chromera_velia_CCMP2878 / gene_product=hypothetical protein / transcript_product=hypothetical protein / location=Cvel_scaffold549:53447-61452(+) / protein_length=413 / sequence_SO=supercontig / SO=protein_coding / is_pseudo=false